MQRIIGIEASSLLDILIEKRLHFCNVNQELELRRYKKFKQPNKNLSRNKKSPLKYEIWRGYFYSIDGHTFLYSIVLLLPAGYFNIKNCSHSENFQGTSGNT